MTILLADIAQVQKSQMDLSSPVNLLKYTPDPTYCSICACPCLNPRLPTPQPDDPDVPYVTDLPTPAWLHQYHHLQPSKGILPYPYEPASRPSQTHAYSSPQEHIVPVHLYCLRAIISMTQSDLWNCISDHPDSMMIGWTVPRWTGFGPWVKGVDVRPTTGMGWLGLEDQQKRYIQDIEGSHLRSCDLVSPQVLDSPLQHRPTSDVIKRKEQSSLLPFMPPHIITEIARDLLIPNTPGGHNPAKQLNDLLSFCRTCHSFRHLDLPAKTWSDLTLAAVNRFREAQIRRWRANPTGSGGVAQVWIALDQAFVAPIEKALNDAESARPRPESALHDDWFETSNAEPTARDVLYWWLYSDVWRSRRRVWHSVIYACAASRDADWMF